MSQRRRILEKIELLHPANGPAAQIELKRRLSVSELEQKIDLLESLDLVGEGTVHISPEILTRGDTVVKVEKVAPARPATVRNAEARKRRYGFLKQYRTQHELTMPDLGRRTGISVSAIQGMARGDRTRYSEETLSRLLKAICVSREQW